ncbi:hypothetical protein HNR46_001724 [Haloferula luteola]|uniref:VWFA domain-containing protein n=1 Tax=Haloferula luteola TaxID=595692 RepID=A0A840UZE5_9BACT|nr:vWA domain-containing protein [Haloferula luteola]MBB5351487.1 hypothetical protein [Haloferula luteola]
MTWDAILPIPWIVIIAIMAVGITLSCAIRANRRLGRLRAGFLTTMRLLGVVGLLALLLQPSRRESLQPPARQRSLLVAVDTSASMDTPDADGASRLDAARECLDQVILPAAAGTPVNLFVFHETSRPIRPSALTEIANASGPETHFHSSIERILEGTFNPPPTALLLLTDGHDLEGEPATRTARIARDRNLPIFPIPIGTPETSPDVSIRIASYHPYTFVGQTTYLTATLRAQGFSHQALTIDLYREEELISTRTVDPGGETFIDVQFPVTEEQAGQFGYTLRVRPMRGEKEASNNSATTYLNIVDDLLRVLEIEGNPYWDSTFLRRSITRNDKFEIDSLVAFSNGRIRAIRSDAEKPTDELKPPSRAEDFENYHMVLLGQNCERVLGQTGIAALQSWVTEHQGIVVFTRGQAWPSGTADDLEPITWGDGLRDQVNLDLTSTQGFPPLDILREARRNDDQLRFDTRPGTSSPKTLATVFGETQGDEPAIVYRRCGKGQTLSMGLANTWRWVFNERTEFDNNTFDRFWDQTTLWLLANRGLTPLSGFSFTANSANIPLGDSITFSLQAAGTQLPAEAPNITLSKEDRPLTSLAMAPQASNALLSATFTPESPGRYTATTSLPDGTTKVIRFICVSTQLERIETAVDPGYLTSLAKSSGGRLLRTDEVASTLKTLLIDTGASDPIERLRPLWPQPPVFLLLVLLLGLDWYFRRKWGLS